MSQKPPKPWFAAKRYGYGSGLPLRWQGWAVLAVYGVLLVVAIKLLGVVLKLAVIVAATLVLAAICVRRTEGGWRWRWGKGR